MKTQVTTSCFKSYEAYLIAKKEVIKYITYRFPTIPFGEVEELVNDAFCVVNNYETEGKLNISQIAYAKTIAFNKSVDWTRKWTTKRQGMTCIEADFSRQMPLDDDSTSLGDKILYEQVVDKIQELRPRLRHILSLKYAVQNIDHTTTVVEMMNFKSHQKPMKSLGIAEIIGSTKAGVRQDVLRATAKLQRLCA